MRLRARGCRCTDGANVRSWIYVTDHCLGLLAAAEKGQSGEVYNIGGDPESELSNKEMTFKILSLLGKPDSLVEQVPDRPAHDRRYSLDAQKIRTKLGWRPATGLSEGLAQTVRWYKEHEGWWQRVKSGAYLSFYEMHYGRKRAVETV